MVCRLDDELWFPDPHFGDDDGCIAIGGDPEALATNLRYRYEQHYIRQHLDTLVTDEQLRAYYESGLVLSHAAVCDFP